MPRPPVLRSISPEATPDEVAAIVAAITEVSRRRALAVEVHVPERSGWVNATRLSGRRSGVQRGSWKLSGRIGRRSRA